MPQTRETHGDSRLTKVLNLGRLEKIEENSVCIVLSKAIEKLKMIQQLLPDPETEGHQPYQPLATRMTTLQKITPPGRQESDSTIALKQIQKCRHMSQQALEKMVKGASRSEGMLQFLKQIILSENRRYYDKYLLKQENLNLNNTIFNLNDKIKEVRENSRETRLYLDKMTQFCLQQAETTVWAQSQTLRRNTEVFQQARVEQNNHKLRDREENTTAQREQSISEITKEDIVYNEITNHLETVTSALQKKFEKWTARYSEEVDALDIALLQLRSKMEDQQEKFATISEQQAAKQELLMVLQAEADERDREQEKRLAVTKAAFIIQHWWRHILLFRPVRKSRKATLKKSRKSRSQSPKKSKKLSLKKKKK